jgi:GntR family transcriptional regulator, rspAB operon transcriptional repressor
MSRTLELPALDTVRAPTAADQVFAALYRQVLTLELPPGSRLSEAEVARLMGVSRQPVRDAFWRLSQLGFLTIRPQRPTTVSPISERSVEQARFIRTALEAETVRLAVERCTPEALAALERQLADQADAVAADDRERFHGLDDEFHRMLADMAGQGFAWALIRESKAHMDRARFMSLAFSAEQALADHRLILDALGAGDAPAAVALMRRHLGRISDIIARISSEHAEYVLRDQVEAPPGR